MMKTSCVVHQYAGSGAPASATRQGKAAIQPPIKLQFAIMRVVEDIRENEDDDGDVPSSTEKCRVQG